MRLYLPGQLRAAYQRDVRRMLSSPVCDRPITQDDVAPLPEVVQRYLRVACVVGTPRVRNMRVKMHGRIRKSPDAPWMPITAEQHNFFDEPARFFYLNATRLGVPVQAYHRFEAGAATMTVTLAGLLRVASGEGPVMTRSETVTLFNDMCLMAPASLVRAPVSWENARKQSVRAIFTNAGIRIQAELRFGDDGELVDFISDDRAEMESDGSQVPARWSTPVSGYRSYGRARLFGTGEARWQDAHGDWPYIQLEIDEIAYNLPRLNPRGGHTALRGSGLARQQFARSGTATYDIRCGDLGQTPTGRVLGGQIVRNAGVQDLTPVRA